MRARRRVGDGRDRRRAASPVVGSGRQPALPVPRGVAVASRRACIGRRRAARVGVVDRAAAPSAARILAVRAVDGPGARRSGPRRAARAAAPDHAGRRIVEATHRRPTGHDPSCLDVRPTIESPAAATRDGRVRLSVRGRWPTLACGDASPSTTTLRRPRNFANPGGFDVVGRLARRGIHVDRLGLGPGRRRRGRDPRPAAAALRSTRWRERRARARSSRSPRPTRQPCSTAPRPRRRRRHRRRRCAGRSPERGVVHVLSVSGLHVGMRRWRRTAACDRLVPRAQRAPAPPTVDRGRSRSWAVSRPRSSSVRHARRSRASRRPLRSS